MDIITHKSGLCKEKNENTFEHYMPLDSETQESIKDYLFSIGICTSSGKRYSVGSALKDYGFTFQDQSHRKGCRKIISKINGGIF